jgi:hypothetical protein
MKKLLLTILCLTSLFSAKAQNQNAMAFDGIDDYVSASGASSYVIGAQGMSITCWVYPTNSAPAYPNFDGFAGFRNDVDADFYMVQVGPTALEGRFRNDQGTAFTLTSNILTVNTWQHLALTYSDGWLRVYKNGVLRDSMAATGGISNPNVDFKIGTVTFSNADFLLTGKMDETSFWSRRLTDIELKCIPSNGIDTAISGLELYYKFNQGTAGGNNTSIASLIDSKAHQDGTFNGLSLTGNTSNFVAGATTATITTGYLCPGGSYTYNGNVLTVAGSYVDTLQNSQGCDSLVQLNLVQLLVDTSVTQNGFTFTANHVSPTYKWLDCNNGYAVVPGAISQSFTPTVPGSYAVVISQSGCTDTSNCHVMATVGLNSLNAIQGLIVYPTYTNDVVKLDFNQTRNNVNIAVMDISGKVVYSVTEDRIANTQISLNEMADGMYFIRVTADDESGVYRVIKK